MLCPDSSRNIGYQSVGREGSDHVKPCDSNWVNIEQTQLEISLSASNIDEK